MGHFYPPPSGEVVVCVELFLQLQGLVSCVGLSSPPSKPASPSEQMGAPWKEKILIKTTGKRGNVCKCSTLIVNEFAEVESFFQLIHQLAVARLKPPKKPPMHFCQTLVEKNTLLKILTNRKQKKKKKQESYFIATKARKLYYFKFFFHASDFSGLSKNHAFV